jgi:hypothetical protein
MNKKRELFEGFHKRMDEAINQNFYLEASWYAYAIIEDRLVSMLLQSGGIGLNGGSAPIRMLGKKLSELERRAGNDELLKVNLVPSKIRDWASSRNELMHAMADGSLDQQLIDKNAYLLATSGKALVRDISAAAMRLKKHRAKVP